MSVRVGIVGAGIIANAHLKALQKIRDAQVVAIAEPEENKRMKLVQKFKIKKAFKDYRELLNLQDIDVIYICTPNHLHHPIAVDALIAGKHVICEKPLARTLKEAEEMIQTSKKTGKKLFIALNHRFNPVNQKVKELLQEGIIGAPFLTVSTFIGDEYERMKDSSNWKGTYEKSGGGVLIDNGTHIIDILRYFFGEVEAVTATCKNLLIQTKNKAEDTALLSIEFKNNVLAELSLTFSARYSTWPTGYRGAAIRIEIYGSEGAVRATNEEVPLTVSKGNKIKRFNYSDIKTSLPTDQNSHFIECILNNKDPIVTVEDGKAALEVVSAAYRSAREGRRVLIEEIR